METEDLKPRDYAGLKVTNARSIPWQAPLVWGVAVEYEGGKHLAYEVGTKEQAETELLSIRKRGAT